MIDFGDDMTLVRFLRARKHNLTAAVIMYEKARVFRAENKLDSVLYLPPSNESVIEKISAQTCTGVDHEGRPVYFFKIGSMHVDYMIKFSVEAAAECHNFQQERALYDCLRASQVKKKAISKFSLFMDISGLSMAHRKTLKFMKYTSFCDSNFYPETMVRRIAFNSSTLATY